MMNACNKPKGICYKLPVCSTHLLYNYPWVENQSDHSPHRHHHRHCVAAAIIQYPSEFEVQAQHESTGGHLSL